MTQNDIPVTEIERMRKEFTKELEEFYKERISKPEWDSKRIADVIHIIEEYEEETTARDPTHYYYHTVYEVKELNGQKVLTNRKNKLSNKIIKIVPSEDYFEILLKSHLSTGHGGRDKMNVQLKDQVYIPSTIIAMFPKHCKNCQSKRLKKASRPAAACDYKRGLLHVIDMTKIPDNTNDTVNYNYIMYYQDRMTKFLYLRALSHNSANDVALELFRIFAEMGGPGIINSTIDGGFTEDVINSLTGLYPGLILMGRLIQPMERDECEEHVKSRVLRWMTEKKCSRWSIGIHIVASSINNEFDEELERSPYKAMFGVAQKQGIDVTTLPDNVVLTLHTEDDLEKWLDTTAQLKKLSRKSGLRNANNRQRKYKKSRASDQEKKPLEEIMTDRSTETEQVWCWVCERDDKSVTCRCHSCNGAIHECCGTYKDESKTVLECNLCSYEKKVAAPDGKVEIKVEIADIVEVTETKIG